MCAGAGGTFNRKTVFISVVQTHTLIYVAQSNAGEALRIFLLDGTGVKTAAGIGDMNGKQILAHGGTDGDGDKIIFIRRAVQDGVLYKRLQNKARYCPVSGSIFNLIFHLKAPCVAQLLNVAVVFQVAQLIVKRN